MGSNLPRLNKSQMFLKSILCIRNVFRYCYHSVNGTVMVCPKGIPLSDIHCTKFLFVQTLKPSYNCLAKYVCNFYSSHTPNNIKLWKQKHTKCKKKKKKRNNEIKMMINCFCSAVAKLIKISFSSYLNSFFCSE